MRREPLFRRKTAISYKTEEKTVMRGYNLSDLAEEGYSFYDAMFVLFQNRIPTEEEEQMLKYEMGVFLEHSMSPSAVGAIGVSAGRPNLPACVAAAVSTFGGVHGPGAAHGYMLNKYLERAQKEGKTIDEMAKTLVDEYMDAGRPVMGMGQPQHIDSDPRAEPIHLKQEELELEGRLSRIPAGRGKTLPRPAQSRWPLLCGCQRCGVGEHGPDGDRFLTQCRMVHRQCGPGLQLCSPRAVQHEKRTGLGGSRNEPMVQMIDLSMIKYVGPEDRIVPKQEERQEYAKKQKEEGEYKQWVI
jgi:hypothetical protein